MSITVAIIAVTCIVSFIAFSRSDLMAKLVLQPARMVRHNEYWRILTHGFVHADGAHLLFNMITLYFFGRIMEWFYVIRLGELGFVLFYLGGIVVAALPSFWQHRHDLRYASLGASGAVFAVLFSFILLQPWALIYIFFLPLPAIVFAALYIGYSLYMERKGTDRINHSAHLWGMAYGLVFSLVIEPRLLSHFFIQLLHPSF